MQPVCLIRHVCMNRVFLSDVPVLHRNCPCAQAQAFACFSQALAERPRHAGGGRRAASHEGS